MRREPTDPERRLWNALRRDALGLKARRQVPLGPYIADFYVPAVRLVIELDGHTHVDADADADAARDAWFAAHGVRVLRFSNDEVMRNLPGVLAAIQAAAPPPSPTLPRKGGGGADGAAGLPSPLAGEGWGGGASPPGTRRP